MMSNNIADRISVVRDRVAKAAIDADRDTASVSLLVVSKTKPVSDIESAYNAGQRLFGENYVQEGVEKIQALEHLADIEWHFIGPLQSNKTRLVAEHFDWMQSIEREKIARRLHEQRPDNMPDLQILLQVNLDNESTKAGVTLANVQELAEQVSRFDRLTLRGLMAIPKADATEQQQAESYQALYTVFQELKEKYPTIDTLSLGMTNDLEAAVKHGSTMVRIGTAIFGERN